MPCSKMPVNAKYKAEGTKNRFCFGTHHRSLKSYQNALDRKLKVDRIVILFKYKLLQKPIYTVYLCSS